VVQRLKLIKHTNKFADRLKKKTIRLEKGEDAVPKGETMTIEKMRVEDEGFIEDANDEEVLGAEKMDEFASYFANQTEPKILLTTNKRPKGVSTFLANDHSSCSRS